MDVSDSAIMNLMRAQMDYQGKRQAMIANNIANIDRPEFEARDMKAFDFERLVAGTMNRLQMRATNAQHLPPVKPTTDDFTDSRLRSTFETTPVGNNVSIDQQTALASKNSSQFALTGKLFRKYTSFYRTAAVGPR